MERHLLACVSSPSLYAVSQQFTIWIMFSKNWKRNLLAVGEQDLLSPLEHACHTCGVRAPAVWGDMRRWRRCKLNKWLSDSEPGPVNQIVVKVCLVYEWIWKSTWWMSENEEEAQILRSSPAVASLDPLPSIFSAIFNTDVMEQNLSNFPLQLSQKIFESSLFMWVCFCH